MTRQAKFAVLAVTLASAFAAFSSIDFSTLAQAAPAPAAVTASANAGLRCSGFLGASGERGPGGSQHHGQP